MNDRKSGRPSPLSDEIRRYLERSGIAERIEQAGAVPAWPDAVGPAIAAVTTPLRVDQGVLIVAVRSSPWLMELKLMEREILARINDGRERGAIKRIRFVMADG
ncbi:MAG TPA: DUF721 domain-containing protein [Longimicrobiales bacterium]|nr:DUF721 domain-containing protein [Longimicrobiales bacterium]